VGYQSLLLASEREKKKSAKWRDRKILVAEFIPVLVANPIGCFCGFWGLQGMALGWRVNRTHSGLAVKSMEYQVRYTFLSGICISVVCA